MRRYTIVRWTLTAFWFAFTVIAGTAVGFLLAWLVHMWRG